MTIQKGELKERLNELGLLLVSKLNSDGYWKGQVSSSAVSVAMVNVSLYLYDKKKYYEEIGRGLNFLRININFDGSYGDTPESIGSIVCSMVVYSSLNLFCKYKNWIKSYQQRIAMYLMSQGIDMKSPLLPKIILNKYEQYYEGIPLVVFCAFCNVLDEKVYDYIPKQIIGLTLSPKWINKLFKIEFSDYLVSSLIGTAIFFSSRKKSFLFKNFVHPAIILKNGSFFQKTFPRNGGVLDSVPLTSFIIICLIKSGYPNVGFVKNGVRFIKNCMRDDGGCPVYPDFSTRVTFGAVNSFRSYLNGFLYTDLQDEIADHLKLIQFEKVQTINGNSSGGWGWTYRPGTIPNANDTAGTILALLKLQPVKMVKNEVLHGCKWLLKIQNRDGGIPLFRKGGGKIFFQKSCPELTGQCIRAFSSVIDVFQNELSGKQIGILLKAIKRACKFTGSCQKKNGCWTSAWSKNQFVKDQLNPIYSTANVVLSLKELCEKEYLKIEARKKIKIWVEEGEDYLIEMQNKDGSWGGINNICGTIEETSLVVSALISYKNRIICDNGLKWLNRVYSKKGLNSAPLFFEYTFHWRYDEKMLPLINYMEALGRRLELKD